MHSDEMTTALAMLERALNRLSDTQVRLASAMEAASLDAQAHLAKFEQVVLIETAPDAHGAEL